MPTITENFIRVKYSVSEDGSTCFALEDFGCESESEWDNLKPKDQNMRIQKALDNLPDRPRWFCDHYNKVK